MAKQCSECGATRETFAEGGGPHNRKCPDCLGSNDGLSDGAEVNPRD